MIKEKLLNIFDENGFLILEGEEDALLDIDSIQFLSVIVQIEGEFSVEIPDEFLISSLLNTFNDFLYLIKSLIHAS